MSRAYPLDWPENWERTPARERRTSRYRQLSFAITRDNLIMELERSGASNVVISSNLPLLQNGLPSGNSPEPTDPGIAVYWTAKDGNQNELACDEWFLTSENIRSLLKAVQALRQLELCGARQLVTRAYKGFAALPPSSEEPAQRPWWVVIGVSAGASVEEIKAAYRKKLMSVHPDRSGGSTVAMQELNAAYQDVMAQYEPKE